MKNKKTELSYLIKYINYYNINQVYIIIERVVALESGRPSRPISASLFSDPPAGGRLFFLIDCRIQS